MKHLLKLAALAAAIGAVAHVSAAPKEHSFSATGATIDVRMDGARITGGPIAPSAVGLPMTMQIGGTDNVTRASSTPFTFGAVGQQHTYFVQYASGTFSPGQAVRICITDTPGASLNNGGEGWCTQNVGLNPTVGAGAFQVAVPAGSWAGWALLAALLGVAGMRLARRRGAA